MKFTDINIVGASDYFVSTGKILLTSSQNILTLFTIEEDSCYEIGKKELSGHIFDLQLISDTEAIVCFEQFGVRLKIPGLTINHDPLFEKLSILQGRQPEGNFLLTHRGSDLLNQTSLIYDLDKKEIIADSDENLASALIEGKLFGILFNNQVNRYSEQTGEKMWSFEIPPSMGTFFDGLRVYKTKVDNFLGIYNKCLWISLTNGVLIALDCNTGQPLHVLCDLPKHFKYTIHQNSAVENIHIPFGQYMQLDSQNNNIIGLRGKWYFEIDLNSNELQRTAFDISENFKNYDINDLEIASHKWPMNKNYIYVCDSPNAVIGLFDRNRKEIVISRQLFEPTSSFSQIKRMTNSEDKLFIQDFKNNLYVVKLKYT